MFDVVSYALAKRALRRAINAESLPTLASLIIDTNKDWKGYSIRNIGPPSTDSDVPRARAEDILSGRFPLSRLPDIVAGYILEGAGAGRDMVAVNPNDRYTPAPHASRHAYGGADAIPDRGIARSQLEYPTVDVPFAWLLAIGKADWSQDDDFVNIVATVDSFADRRIELVAQVGAVYGDARGLAIGRHVNGKNYYKSSIYAPRATADHFIGKYVAGTWIELATEAVDLTAEVAYALTFSINGTTLKSWRQLIRDLTVAPTLSATDTALASGRWGSRYVAEPCILGAPASPAPKPIAYFEVPVIGSGTLEDPFRAGMPEEIVDDPVYGRVNRLALTFSALIPTDPATGKPLHGTAIVMILDQPDRQAHLHPIPKCLDALRAMPKVRELRAEEAKALALKMDDKLHPFDLMSVPEPSRAQVREYIEWRRSTFNVEVSEEDATRYVSEDKGWE